MSKSLIRQNYHLDTEAAVNKQINLELSASYVYQSMAWYFERDDVALHGFSHFFSEQSKEEREHAEKLMKLQNQRGGTIKLYDIPKPPQDSWGTPLEAMEAALALEKKVNVSLLELHKIGDSHGDANFCDFIESEFLTEQVESIKQLSGYVTNLKRVGPGLGEYLFDKKELSS